MVDLLDVSIEYAIAQGRKDEALALLRKRGGESGQLFKILADLIDPGIRKKIGRPAETKTQEYKSNQKLMMFEFYFLRAYFEAKKEKGWENPTELAKGYVIANGRYANYFKKAKKLYGDTMEKLVENHLKLMDEQNIDFPEWVKKYPIPKE